MDALRMVTDRNSTARCPNRVPQKKPSVPEAVVSVTGTGPSFKTDGDSKEKSEG